ncbi:MAG: sigma 54-interacting transcriptional regulator [Thermotaleaceae bacterium]
MNELELRIKELEAILKKEMEEKKLLNLANRQLLEEKKELQKKMGQGNRDKRINNGSRFTLDDIIGKSIVVQECKDKARRIANYDANILIYGETGTGKELFAQGIHNESLYVNEPFIPLNCSAVPETLIESLLFGTVKGSFTGAENMIGLFEQAGKGTLFLDEINSMPLSMQAKLLRVLQEKKIRRIGDNKDIDIECCIISATNVEPKDTIKKNIMREDFFYRIATVQLIIPPLRERKEDIPILIDHFIKKANQKFGKYIENIDGDAMHYLEEYKWPGNIRELINTLECAIMLCEDNQRNLTAEVFPSYIYYKNNRMKNRCANEKEIGMDCSGDLRSLLDNYERKIIMNTIYENKNNISSAAKQLGIDRKSLYRKMAKYNLR